MPKNLNAYKRWKSRLIKSGCTKCPALCKNRNNIVVDRGNPNASVVIIGEAPGRKEDETGEPFVGAAGKVLDKIMASIGLDTNKDTIILNVVKCRPPNNRVPRVEEELNCLPYLNKQISFLKPKVIVLLGATAVKHFLGASYSMKALAGTTFDHEDYPGIKLMILYHPAALLYDPSKKKVMWKHVRKLREYLK